jgi:hypothetical protein
MIAKVITPEPIHDEWEMRARNWFLAHGGSYDELTGEIICSDGLRIPRENWKKIVKEIKEGKRQFTPDREKDLLTLVLENDEHGGRTRGFGLSYPWWLGFAKDQETYKAEREQRSDSRMRKMTSSTSCLPNLTSNTSRLMNLEE